MKRCFALISLMVILSALMSCRDGLSPEQRQAIRTKLVNSLVFVEGGTFMMGDAGTEIIDENGDKVFSYWTGDKDTGPAHKVTLDSYSIMKFEVTYGDFDLFSNATGRELLEKRALEKERRGPGMPVWGVPWQDAKDYCLWLGKVTGLPCDLPTEAQWEYAARSRGMNVAYATDNGKLDYRRNYRGKGAPWHPQAPGTYPPNPLGLYDMTGNVWEWVDDWYDPYYYEHSLELNPKGPDKGKKKIMKGGDVIGSPGLNILYRRRIEPIDSTDGGGIRCVVNLTTPVKKE